MNSFPHDYTSELKLKDFPESKLNLLVPIKLLLYELHIASYPRYVHRYMLVFKYYNKFLKHWSHHVRLTRRGRWPLDSQYCSVFCFACGMGQLNIK